MKNKEKRVTPDAKIELRQEDDKHQVRGIASKVGVVYDLGFFSEEIAPGAFDNVLNDDVRVLFNHDANMVLARTASGTGRVFLDNAGNLSYEFDTPNRSYAKDLEDMIRTGDVSQSSFAFIVAEQEWQERDGKDHRVITRVEQLIDVSPVTYPASPDTEVAYNSLDKVKTKRNTKKLAAAERERHLTLLNAKLKL